MYFSVCAIRAVCWARRNFTNLNWPLWEICVPMVPKRPKLWFHRSKDVLKTKNWDKYWTISPPREVYNISSRQLYEENSTTRNMDYDTETYAPTQIHCKYVIRHRDSHSFLSSSIQFYSIEITLWTFCLSYRFKINIILDSISMKEP